MNEEPDHRIDELEDQIEAADSLIKSLEEEVGSLRRDLEQASLALQVAQQEVSARERALEERDQARTRAEQQAQVLRDSITELRTQNSDEQLQLRNKHIAELARMQDRFGAQRISDMGRNFSGDGAEALKEEYQRDLQELEQRRWREIEALESSYEEWSARLLDETRELKEHHKAEIRELRRGSEKQERELRKELREDEARRREEMLQAAEARHEDEVRALREGFEERERTLQEERQVLVEEHRAELETLREQAGQSVREAEEKRQEELRELKTLAENRERELRRGQSAKMKEAGEEAERRLTSLQAQRKADNEALKSRYEKELDRLHQEHEEQLAAEVERRRREVLSLEEKFESVKLERTSEARAYIDRLKELNAPQMVPSNGRVEIEASPDADDEDRAEVRELKEQVSELEEALASTRDTAEQLATELEESKSRAANEIAPEPELLEPVPQEPEPTAASEEVWTHTEQRDESAPDPAEDDARLRELETRLQQAREERRQYADELGDALDKLRRLSDPEHRLRAGISAFNESHHTRNVASISKALGLPVVNAGVEGDAPGKPTFTFVWGDISWRRYVAEPIEGLEEPRVYLVASGDDPESLPPEREANARIDARGRLMLGIQAR